MTAALSVAGEVAQAAPAHAEEALCRFRADVLEKSVSVVAATLKVEDALVPATAEALAAAVAATAAFASWAAVRVAPEMAMDQECKEDERKEKVEARCADVDAELRCEQVLGEFHAAAWARVHAEANESEVKGRTSETACGLWSWREAFGVCCLMRCALACARVARSSPLSWEDTATAFFGAVWFADLGLIVAGPDAHASAALFDAAERLSAAAVTGPVPRSDAKGGSCEAEGTNLSDWSEVPNGSPCSQLRTLKRKRVEALSFRRPLATLPKASSSISYPVKEVPTGRELDLEEFLHSLSERTPVVVRGGCATWPAIERWGHGAFWADGAIGCRFVPVEMDYWLDRGFQLMRIRDFVEHCFVAEARDKPMPGLSGGGYIAQHALLDQVRSLAADVMTPDIALCGPKGQVMRQMFFGPVGTVTPLHYDPDDNVFCQIVGAKYLRLYPPSETARLYAREGSLPNNSMVEPPDILLGENSGAYCDSFPKFVDAKYVETVLEPSDLLYIPLGWWHFVKSLSTSISVAFVFN